jgi:periplasmic copper chaperone A
MSKTLFVITIAAACLLAPACVSAHVTLERNEAPADSFFNTFVNVPHGCEGSPTLRVRVRIPEGVIGVKPQPKANWELSVRKERLATPIVEGHGRTITEVVAEVTWSGKLADDNFDQFGIHMKLPDKAGATLYFPTVQECETGVHRWIEIPAAGKSRGDYKEPAPFLRLLPKGQRH